jgi:NADPH:quinone reductase-like Zn-dependent oxidoreductase
VKALTYDPERERFQVADLPVPTPGDMDVLVRVAACGLNPVDAKIGGWKAMVPDMTPAWVPGLDVSGRIAAVGRGVEGWTVGDAVLYHGDMLRPHGGFAEYAIHDFRTLVPHPALDPIAAAATPCAGWTAWRALTDKLPPRPGGSILIAGGAGGVGGFAIQVARHVGLARIIVTASAVNHEYVRELGATDVIDYRTEDVVRRVLDMTDGEGVALGLDTVGLGNDQLVADALAFEGHMLELVGTVRPTSYRDAFMRGLSFHQLSLGSGHRSGGAAGRETAALSAMLERRTVGKIVMRSDG